MVFHRVSGSRLDSGVERACTFVQACTVVQTSTCDTEKAKDFPLGPRTAHGPDASNAMENASPITEEAGGSVLGTRQISTTQGAAS
jgi:hypothetical protein